MKGAALFVAGLAVGVVAGVLFGPASETSCCKRVNAAVRDEIGDRFGSGTVAVLDGLGVSDRFAGALDFFGAPHDFGT